MLQAVAIYEYDDTADRLELIRVNKAYYDLFGYSDIDNIQINLVKTLNEEGIAVMQAAFHDVAANKQMVECEFTRRVESGSWIWVQLKLKYISRVGQKHVIYGTLEDITKQKELDRELQKYRRAFEEHVKKKKTILVVDDLRLNRAAIRGIFANEYEIAEAENGQEALNYLAAHPEKADIILLDIVMPVMDGREFLERKKKDASIADIPVVIITSDDTEKCQAEMLELGADDYIIKPFVSAIAERRIRNVLESQKRLEKTLKNL